MDKDEGNVAAGKVGQSPRTEYRPLDALIGRWMTTGHTFGPDGAPAAPIAASDIYEWAPGGFFILHTAYGTIGEQGAGGIEMIGYDAETRQFHTTFFDSQGKSPAKGCRWTERPGRGLAPRFAVRGRSKMTVKGWSATTNASKERPGCRRWM